MVLADQAAGVGKDRFVGLIGLAPKNDNNNLPSFMSQIHPGLAAEGNSTTLSPLFSIFLSKNSGEEGAITFGGFDVDLYGKPGKKASDIFWIGTSPAEKYWTAGMDSVSLTYGGGL